MDEILKLREQQGGPIVATKVPSVESTKTPKPDKSQKVASTPTQASPKKSAAVSTRASTKQTVSTTKPLRPSRDIGKRSSKPTAQKTKPPSEDSGDKESAVDEPPATQTEHKTMTKAQAAKKAKAGTLKGAEHNDAMDTFDG